MARAREFGIAGLCIVMIIGADVRLLRAENQPALPPGMTQQQFDGLVDAIRTALQHG